MTGTADGRKTTSLLRSRRYSLFWVASLFSNIGTWMQQVAQPWVMLTISHSSFLVGLDSFAMNAPGWILTLWGGVLADRLDRKKVILFFQAIQFLAIIGLVALLAWGILAPWMLILISLVVGTTDSLSTPSFQTIVPSLVQEEEIPRAVSLNAIQFNLSRTLGPALAGVVMVQFGALACFGANAVSFIPFFLSILWIYPVRGFETRAPEPDRDAPSLLATVKEVLESDGVRTQLFATFITTLFCSPLVTFCPVLVQEVFGGQIRDFGRASTAFGFGGLVGALLAYFLASRFKTRSPSHFGLLLGCVLVGVSVNRSPFLLWFLMLLGGGLLTIANTTANANLQARAANRVRGRQASLYQLAFRGGIALGGLATGWNTAHFGIVRALLLNGSLAIALHLMLLVRRWRLPGRGPA